MRLPRCGRQGAARLPGGGRAGLAAAQAFFHAPSNEVFTPSGLTTSPSKPLL
jgi:hypothetical protein